MHPAPASHGISGSPHAARRVRNAVSQVQAGNAAGLVLRALRQAVLEAPLPPVAGAIQTDAGNLRATNEDCVCFLLPAPSLPGLAILADGMGGHAAGEVASALAVATVQAAFFAARGTVPQRLRTAFQAANSAILEHARQSPGSEGMGTTCTTLVFAADGVFLAHVGDSRAYVVGIDGVRQVSADHTLVASLVQAAQMTPEEARTSPERNVLVSAMGLQDALAAQIPALALTVSASDRLVLCSDGLSDLVSDAEIGAAAMAQPPDDACRALITLAKQRGGHDNISVGVFLFGTLPESRDLADTRRIDISGLAL